MKIMIEKMDDWTGAKVMKSGETIKHCRKKWRGGYC